jgi:HNH/ENDO VII superfamily nuclease
MSDVSLVPVDHQPAFDGVSLVPVEHDPFADDAATRQGQSPQAHTQPAQSQPAQPQQPAMGASQSGAPAPGVATTGSTGSALSAGTSDFFRSIPRGIVSGFNNAASALGRATQAEMGQDVDAPTPEQGMQILEREVTGPMHRPEGRAGKFGASVGEFLGNPSTYLAPGSLPLKIGTAVLGGLGSEAGGQLGEGTPLEGPLRFAGGLLGALGPLSAGRLVTGARAAQTLAPAAQEAGSGLRAPTKAIRRSPASRAAEKGFAGIGATPNGGPTFAGTEHLYPASSGQQSVVNIPLTGGRKADVKLANEWGGFIKKPKGYSWHHVDDFTPQSGTSSLELVDQKAHEATYPHAGSVSQYEKFHGKPYKR